MSEQATPVAPQRLPGINTIGMGAPVEWLAAGWRDFLAAPGISLLYGSVLAAISAGIFWVLYSTGSASWFYVLLGGFLIVGPMLGMGLYAMARSLALGEKPKLLDVIWV